MSLAWCEESHKFDIKFSTGLCNSYWSTCMHCKFLILLWPIYDIFCNQWPSNLVSLYVAALEFVWQQIAYKSGLAVSGVVMTREFLVLPVKRLELRRLILSLTNVMNMCCWRASVCVCVSSYRLGLSSPWVYLGFALGMFSIHFKIAWTVLSSSDLLGIFHEIGLNLMCRLDN